MKIAIDMDYTLYRPVKGMIIEKSFHGLKKENIAAHRNRIKNILQGKYRKRTLFRRVHSFHIAKHAHPLFEAQKVINHLSEKGHQIFIVSHRPHESEDNTRKWLEYHQIPFDNIICHSEIDKINYCKQRNIDVLIDDHPKNILSGIKNNFPVYGLTWKHNRRFVPEKYLFANWKQIEKEILSLEKSLLKTKA